MLATCKGTSKHEILDVERFLGCPRRAAEAEKLPLATRVIPRRVAAPRSAGSLLQPQQDGVRLALAAALTHAAALNASLPQFDNTCWDDDPLTPCPTPKAANDRYASLAMPGGHQPPKLFLIQPARRASGAMIKCCSCGRTLRDASRRCGSAKLDDAEARQIKCDKTAMLAHTWWDGPMVRVVALFLREFQATPEPDLC